MHRLSAVLLLSILCWLDFGWVPASHSIAPPRSGQPYAESICNTDPNIIFCEDFNYPSNFIMVSQGNPTHGPWRTTWVNPGLTTQVYGFVWGTEGRRINPATTYPAKPAGALPSGSQPDHVWAANWDPALGVTGNGSTWGSIIETTGNYANGAAPTKEIYFRFQYYVTADYVWPGDPRRDKYDFGTACFPTDNKILYMFGPGWTTPTDAAAVVGLTTTSGQFDPLSVARFTDGLAIRYGDHSLDYFKFFPGCNSCVNSGRFHNYFPYQSLTVRNPNDTPQFKKVFRFNANRWYTIETRARLSSTANALDGIVEVWIDGVKTYSETNLATCGPETAASGSCRALGVINLDAYHNTTDCTVWDGQQVIDNLVISRSYIGPPRGGSADTQPPAAPMNLKVQ